MWVSSPMKAPYFKAGLGGLGAQRLDAAGRFWRRLRRGDEQLVQAGAPAGHYHYDDDPSFLEKG